METEKLSRQKIQERLSYDDKDRRKVLEKAKGRCARCGKPLSIHYKKDTPMEDRFTMDHFIPLSEGGTNRILNIIPLCGSCNQEKGSRVCNPKDYLPYLLPEHKKKLMGLYESFLGSFEFLNRNNILANDVYSYEIPGEHWARYMFTKRKGGRKKKLPPPHKYEIRRARYDDLDRILDFYIRYLKKYELLESTEAAKRNISYWFTYGAIYYAEDRNGEIWCFLSAEIRDIVTEKEEEETFLQVFPFFYYGKGIKSYFVFLDIKRHIGLQVAKEQGLPFLPVIFLIPRNDCLAQNLILRDPDYVDDDQDDQRFLYMGLRVVNDDFVYPDTSGMDIEKMCEVFDRHCQERGYDQIVEDFFVKVRAQNEEIRDYTGMTPEEYAPV